jgi:hypothetical protein
LGLNDPFDFILALRALVFIAAVDFMQVLVSTGAIVSRPVGFITN